MDDNVTADHAAAPARRARGRMTRLIVLVALIAALLVAAGLLPVREYFESALSWVEGLGVWGPVALAVIYTFACVLMAPGSVLTLAGGALFGPLWGTVTVSIASTLGASLAFLVGRTFARSWVAGKVSANPRFAAIDEAVGREGFKIVLLTRLSPIFPFNLLNYAYGLTKVNFRSYFFASWIGMLPGTVMYVYVGHVLGSLTEVFAGRQKAWYEWVFLAAGVAAAVAVALFVGHVARKALRSAVEIDRSS